MLSSKILPFILLTRPKQWIKNFLLFAGIVFSQNYGNNLLLLRAFAGFALFCILSSAVYTVNDIVDVEADRLHPKKKKRPLAAGLISRKAAIIQGAVLIAVGLGCSFLMSRPFGTTALAYLVLSLLYSLIFKNMAIIDVILLASGFVLRAIAGVVAIRVVGGPDVPMTPWFVICILFLALFVAICKRRWEITKMENAEAHRSALQDYNPQFLDQMISVATSATVISYALYLVAGPHGSIQAGLDLEMLSTMPFVLYGVFRYLFLVYKCGEGGEPETLILKDKPFLANLVLWLALMIYLMP